MGILCKVADAECPKGLRICCGTCEDKDTCKSCCENITDNCTEAEVVQDELVAFETAVPEVIQKITNVIKMKKQLEEQEKQLKSSLVEAMEKYNIKSFENEQIKMTYVAPTTQTKLDSTKLKKDHPDIAAEYSKTSSVASYVKVTVK